MKNIVFIFVLLLAGCSAAIDLPTPTATGTATSPNLTATPLGDFPLSPTRDASPTDTCTVSTGVPAGYLNLRTDPGMEYAVIRVLNEGEVLTVTTRGAWHEVTDAEGNRGYVNSKFCK